MRLENGQKDKLYGGFYCFHGPKTFYTLRYPNMEVKASLTDYILTRYSHDKVMKEKVQLKIYRAIPGK